MVAFKIQRCHLQLLSKVDGRNVFASWSPQSTFDILVCTRCASVLGDEMVSVNIIAQKYLFHTEDIYCLRKLWLTPFGSFCSSGMATCFFRRHPFLRQKLNDSSAQHSKGFHPQMCWLWQSQIHSDWRRLSSSESRYTCDKFILFSGLCGVQSMLHCVLILHFLCFCSKIYFQRNNINSTTISKILATVTDKTTITFRT